MKLTAAPRAHFWIRAETEIGERRTPLIPVDAEALIESGFQVTVERCASRIFKDEDYKKVGCRLVKAGSWISAPPETFVLGLKSLPDLDHPISQFHLFFAHAYRGQSNAQKLLSRFKAGSGTILDYEYVVGRNGRRIIGARYESGQVGAALALWGWANRVLGRSSSLPPLTPYSSVEALRKQMTKTMEKVLRKAIVPKILITGARGGCGIGAVDLVSSLGLRPVLWNREDTQKGGPFPEILSYDIWIHCIGIKEVISPFVTEEILKNAADRKLRIISDVTCDVLNQFHAVPLYHKISTFERPTIPIEKSPPLEVIAIDRLSSLVPYDSSEMISSQLLPLLSQLPSMQNNVWSHSRKHFLEAVGKAPTTNSSLKRG